MMIDLKNKRLNKNPENVYLHANSRWWVEPTTFIGRTGLGSQATLPNDSIELGEWITKHIVNDETIVVSGNAAIDVTVANDTYVVSGIVSPEDDNITIIDSQGIYSKIYTTGALISGSGTAIDPLFVSDISLINVEVVNEISDRDDLSADASEGDITKVLNAYGPSISATYVWDGSVWVEITEFGVNIYNTSDSLTSARTVTLNGYDLVFLGSTSDIRFDSTGFVGLNQTNPSTLLHITPVTLGVDDPITIQGLITNNTPEDVLVPMSDGTIKKKSVYLLDTAVVRQIGHGFTLNVNEPFIPVTFDGVTWIRANTLTAADTHDSYIIEIIDADNFRLKDSGYIEYPGHTLNVGEYYFSQDTGLIGVSPDSDINDVVAFVISDTIIQLIDNRAMSAIIGSISVISILNDLENVVITTVNEGDILIYNGGNWVNATNYRHVETATGGQTEINVTGGVLPTNAASIRVYRNGVALEEPTYWSHTTGGVITLTGVTIDAGDLLMVEWLV